MQNTNENNIEIPNIDGVSNIDQFLVHDIKETIFGIKRQLELLEIFVNNLSIEPVNGHIDEDDDDEEWDWRDSVFI